MASFVLDTSALLAFVNGEPGAEIVADVIADAAVSAVNLSEAVAKLVSRGTSLDVARAALAMADYEVADFDRAQAEAAGAMIARTRQAGLSLGDRACLALAQREGALALTADRSWSSVDVGVEVRVFR
jgi:PIN domain nuclease of toxin-antitoxin system